jgi:hypothetical protein
MENDNVILYLIGVEFHAVCSLRDRNPESRKGVFWCDSAGAAMRQYEHASYSFGVVAAIFTRLCACSVS